MLEDYRAICKPDGSSWSAARTETSKVSCASSRAYWMLRWSPTWPQDSPVFGAALGQESVTILLHINNIIILALETNRCFNDFEKDMVSLRATQLAYFFVSRQLRYCFPSSCGSCSICFMPVYFYAYLLDFLVHSPVAYLPIKYNEYAPLIVYVSLCLFCFIHNVVFLLRWVKLPCNTSHSTKLTTALD